MDFPASILDWVRAVDDRIVLVHHPVIEADDEVPPATLAAAEALDTRDVLPTAVLAHAHRLRETEAFASEPLSVDSPCWNHPGSIVTPHVAGFAPDYVEVVGALFADNLSHHFAQRPLLNEADGTRGY